MSQRGGKYLNKKSGRRKKICCGLLIAVLSVIILAGGILAFLFRKDDLQGQWLYGATVYSFDGKGEGSMELPDEAFSYRYVLTEDRLTLDFEDERLSDVAYICVLSEDSLTLTEPTTGSVYELTRK